jgi:hypothetical protein
MVLITIVTGAYKPTYNWGASHCNFCRFIHFFSAERCATSGLTSLWHSMVSAVIRPSVDLDASKFGTDRKGGPPISIGVSIINRRMVEGLLLQL